MDIAISIEDVSSVKKKLTIEIPSQQVQQEFAEVVGEYRKFARLPGFRPGKAPIGLVKGHFRKEIRDEVLQKLIPTSYEQAVKEKELSPIGQPELGELEIKDGEAFRYHATLEIFPEVELPDYKGLKVSVEEDPVDDAAIEEALESMRERHATMEAVEDRPIAEGDQAVIDLKGVYADGEPDSASDPVLESENVGVEVGGRNTMAAFSEALLGMNIAEEKSFQVEYPADYGEKKLAGRKVEFTIEVTDIKTKVLPEINDDFAKDVGDFGSLEELRKKVASDLTEAKSRNRDGQIRQKLVEQLIDQTGFEVPDGLIEAQIDGKVGDIAYNMASQGMDVARAGLDWRNIREEMRSDAEKEVRGDLILAEIANKEEIRVDSHEIEEELQKTADSAKAPIEQVRAYFESEGRLKTMKTQMLRRKTLKFLQDHATIK